MCFWDISLLVKYILLKKKLWAFAIRLVSFFRNFKYYVSFEVIFLLKLINLFSKSVLFTKLACVNLEAKFSAFNSLNSWQVIYLAWSGILFATSLIFVLRTVVLNY